MHHIPRCTTAIIKLFIFIFSAHASEPLLIWDNRETATGLHVFGSGVDKKGNTWAAHEVKIEETSFYQNLFTIPEVYSSMGAGTAISDSKMNHYIQFWTNLFSNGIPRGRITVAQNNELVGIVQLAGKSGNPGVGELIRALHPSVHSNGLGTELLGFIVNEWAPTLRSVALGQYADAPLLAVDKFKCFEGETLHTICATARPSNIKSWKAYKHYDFHPSSPQNDDLLISCVGWEYSLNGPLEEYIMHRFFSADANIQLERDVLYSLLDENEEPRTLSYVSMYGSLRYHFEHTVK